MNLQKLIAYSLFSVIFFSSNVFSKTLLEDKVMENNNWKVALNKLKTGPNQFFQSNAVGGGGTTFYPLFRDHGFLWLDITVENKTDQNREFNFERIRLISDEYVVCGAWSSSWGPSLAWDQYSLKQTINAKKKMRRWVVFVYNKGIYPYKLIYDNRNYKTVFDVMKIDIQ